MKYSPSNLDYTPNDVGPPEKLHYKDHELMTDAEMFDQLEAQQELNLY